MTSTYCNTHTHSIVTFIYCIYIYIIIIVCISDLDAKTVFGRYPRLQRSDLLDCKNKKQFFFLCRIACRSIAPHHPPFSLFIVMDQFRSTQFKRPIQFIGCRSRKVPLRKQVAVKSRDLQVLSTAVIPVRHFGLIFSGQGLIKADRRKAIYIRFGCQNGLRTITLDCKKRSPRLQKHNNYSSFFVCAESRCSIAPHHPPFSLFIVMDQFRSTQFKRPIQFIGCRSRKVPLRKQVAVKSRDLQVLSTAVIPVRHFGLIFSGQGLIKADRRKAIYIRFGCQNGLRTITLDCKKRSPRLQKKEAMILSFFCLCRIACRAIAPHHHPVPCSL